MIWRILAIAGVLALASLQIMSLQHLQEMELDEATRLALEATYRNWFSNYQMLIEAHKGHLVGTGILLLVVSLLFVLPAQREFRDAIAVTGFPVLVSVVCWSVWAVMRVGHEGVDLSLTPRYFLGLVGFFSGFVFPTTGILLATAAWTKRRLSKRRHALLCLIGTVVVGWTVWFASLAVTQAWRS